MMSTLPFNLSKCLLSRALLLAWLLTSGQADAVDGREVLTEALIAQRLRQLALVTSREAYTAHARTLDGEPLKAGIAWYYVGLTELHAGEVSAAEQSFERSVRMLAEQPRERDPAFQVTLAQTIPLVKYWSDRLPDARVSVLPSREFLDRLHRPKDVIMLSFALTGTPSSETASPRASNDDQSVVAKPLSYRFSDPAVWIENLQAHTAELPTAASDAEGFVLAAWRRLLLQQTEPVAATGNEAQIQIGNSSESVALRWELLCLSLSHAALTNAETDFEDRLRQLQAAPWLPLWGLRALTLGAGRDERVLRLAQQSIRGMIGEHHPFAGQLLFPQEPANLAKSEYLRDCYYEIGVLHGLVGRAKHGEKVSREPGIEFIRAARLIEELQSPLRRGRSPLSTLRLIARADAAVRVSDFESWQTDALRIEDPYWSDLTIWARSLAGDRRTRSQGELANRDSERQVEQPEMLLLGADDVHSQPSTEPGERAAIAQKNGSWIRKWLILLMPLSLLCGWLWWRRRQLRSVTRVER